MRIGFTINVVSFLAASLLWSCYLSYEPRTDGKPSEPKESKSTFPSHDARLDAVTTPDSSASSMSPPSHDARAFSDSDVRMDNSADEGDANSNSLDGRVKDADLGNSSCSLSDLFLEDDSGVSYGLSPRVRTGTAEVLGAIRAEVVRRIIRRHISEVRSCYTQGLCQTPDLEGRIVVRFVILSTGVVQSADVVSSEFDNKDVEVCIVNAVRRWTFPLPEDGGVVNVTYPFVLQSVKRQSGL